MLNLNKFRFEKLEQTKDEVVTAVGVTNVTNKPSSAITKITKITKISKPSAPKLKKRRLHIDLTADEQHELQTLAILSGKPKAAKKRLSRKEKPQYGVVSPERGVSQIRALYMGPISPVRGSVGRTCVNRTTTKQVDAGGSNDVDGQDYLDKNSNTSLKDDDTVEIVDDPNQGPYSLVAKACKQPSDLSESDFAGLYQGPTIPQTPEYELTSYDLVPRTKPTRAGTTGATERLRQKGQRALKPSVDQLYSRLTATLKSDPTHGHKWWAKMLRYEPLPLGEFIHYVQKTLGLPLTKPQIHKWCDLRGIIVKE